MSRSINIKSLTSLLSRYLFYIIIPISLIAMMPGGGPPGDPYIQAYNTFTADYVATNQNTNQLINNYSNQLLVAITAIRDSAQRASLWAQHQQSLARINARSVEIIRGRVEIMLGHITQHAVAAQGREAAVLANAPGQPPLTVNELNILAALNQAKNIDQQAQNALDQAQAAVNEAQGFVQDINNRFNNIQQRINQMNQPILGINHTNADVTAYNRSLTAIKTHSNHINERAFSVKERASRADNQLVMIRQHMQAIVQLGGNIGIQLPPY